MTYINDLEGFTFNELKTAEPAVVIVSMIGKCVDYHALFDYMTEECGETSVITLSTRAESEAYENYYNNKHFHRILRPILGKRVLEICRNVIVGSNYKDEEETVVETGEKGHILVVDDNAMVLRSIKGILED